jgi:TPR repeat protein/serine/threonine protein kinase
MKQCPMCDTNYPDEHTTCTTDGAVLLEIREWEPGKLVRAKYRVLAKVGQGGMGVVYKATHIVFEEVWALKVMATRLAADPKFVRRFRQEAQVTRKLQHINTVRVQDFDQAEDGSPFIVMEFIEGVSLQQLLQAVKGPLPVARALWIARGIAEGLSAAHGLGMVHRDIKPANILLARDSQDRDVPKILDFGIVAMREGSTSLSGAPLLTAEYGSPEQWKGMKSSELDGRADLYALGVTLFQMLTGRLPFSAQNVEGWMNAHLTETPAPPSRFNPELQQMEAIDDLTLKLLAKDREGRPKDAQAFLTELNLLDAQLSWGQATIVSRNKSVELMQTIQSRPTNDPGVGIATNPALGQVPQAPVVDEAAKKRQAEAEAAQRQQEAERARDEQEELAKARRKNTLIAVSLVAVVLVVALGVWFFFRTQSNPAALVELGLKYEKGEGTSKDLTKAADLYRKAAETGDAAGEFHLASMYRDGDGMQQDLVKAAEWFTKSAQQNYADAENELGAMYQRGQVESQDDSQAIRWYRKSAEQGNSAGEYNLAWMYDNGRGVPKDPAIAANWYRKAADQNNWRAQQTLGEMYATGLGVGQDAAEAYKWINLANDNADVSPSNSTSLRSLLKQVESQMTQSEVEEGKARARAWKALHPAPSK